MNTTTSNIAPPRDIESLEARFALRIAASLSERAEQVPHDIGERLRFARDLAVTRARVVRTSSAAPLAVAVAHNGGGTGTATLGRGSEGRRPWWRAALAASLPLIVFIAGLFLIQERQLDVEIEAMAEVDAALLSDDLPPLAYSDPGFVEFLKNAAD